MSNDTKVYRYGTISIVHRKGNTPLVMRPAKLKEYKTITYLTTWYRKLGVPVHLLVLDAEPMLYLSNEHNIFNNVVPLCGSLVKPSTTFHISGKMPWEGNVVTCKKCLRIINSFHSGLNYSQVTYVV